MTKQNVPSTVIAAIRKRTPAFRIGMDSRIDDLGIQTLDKVNIELDLEDWFGIELPANLEWETVGQLVDLLRQHLAATTVPAHPPCKIKAEG